MSQLPDARQLFQAAEEAAVAGDLASADELLRRVARIQEDQLGPVHPDLASTLNNLAIVAEKTGRLDDAETCYRRAAAIASAALPADHPMVADSRQNLEDFCRASGRPIDVPVVTTPAAPPGPDLAPAAFPPVQTPVAPRAPAPERKPDAGAVMQATTPTPAAAPPLVRPPAAPVSQPPSAARTSPAPQPASRSRAWVAIAAVVLVAAVLLLTRPWSSREPAVSAPASAPPAAPAPAPVAEPPQQAAAEPPATPAPATPAPQPAAPRGGERGVVASPARGQSPAPVPVTLDTAELCATLSTAGGAWRCEAAGDSVAPGSVAFYTRVKSSRDTAIVHRWYRGDALRQSVRLTIRANPAAGYRTYSRQTVDAGADWRVEVRSANGDVLHERRFAVR